MRNKRSGNTLIDAALVLPILFSLAFGTVEFGHYFYVKHSIQGAAREGARAAIVPAAQFGDIATAVGNSLSPAGITSYSVTVQDNSTTITSSNFGSAIATGDPVTVTVQAQWGTVGMRPLGVISTSKQVKGVAVMRKE